MGKHDEFDDFFGDDEDTPVVDTRADGRLYRVPLSRLSRNLVNPRKDFGTKDDLLDLGKSLARRQNQPCPVVSRSAYLKLWPEHADLVGKVDYVLVSGERRFRAATEVGLHSLDCVVNDDFARDRKTFMEAVVSENVDRQNFDAIEEAFAVQALVTEFGSNRAVAQHFERADGWVTQRIYLTHLAPIVQDMVRQKIMPLDAARLLGRLARDGDWSAEQQQTWWSEERERRREAGAAKKEAKAGAKKAATAPPPQRTEPQQTPAGVAAPREVQPVPSPDLSGGPRTAPTVPSFTAVKQSVVPPAPAMSATASRPAVDAGHRPQTAAVPPATMDATVEMSAGTDEVAVVLAGLLQRHGLERVVDALLQRVDPQEQGHLAELVQTRFEAQLEPVRS
jgi:ParB family chromosome partitioning protein